MGQRHRDLDSARQFGRSLQYLHDLQPAVVSSGNDILPILAVNNVLYDAQPKQITVSGLADALSPYITGGGGGTASASGIDGSVQYYSSGILAGDTNFLWDTALDRLTIDNRTGVVASGGLVVTSGNAQINAGDVVLNDGGAYTTTLQTITATANRTISFPDATGTLALVGGSSGQAIYNNAGALAGISTMTFDGTSVTLAGRLINSYTSVASSPAKVFTGTWFTGGTATTTKPHFLIEPTGTSSGAWSPNGTGLGVNAASTFSGNLLDLQLNGGSVFKVRRPANYTGLVIANDANDIASYMQFNAAFCVHADIAIAWNSTGSLVSNTPDLFLRRDAANTLALRNGTNAQTYRVYNTFTSATNYELGKLEWSSNVFRIGTEKGSGGGTARALELQTDGTTRLTVSSTGSITTATGSDFFVNSSRFLGFSGSTTLYAPSNGVLGLYNAATTSFDRLQFGGSTTSFPALKRSSAELQARLADDSGYTTIDAQHRLQGTAPASATATGTAGDIRYDADYIYICTATNTWKRAAIATW